MLVGVGLGPGDKKLLTLAAIEVLTVSDKVFVPGVLAKDLVKPYADAEILDFPMTRDKKVLEEVWERNAKIVSKYAKDHLVSFGLIGDPMFFSTFSHLIKKINDSHPEIEIKVIPGVSSITAFASRADLHINNSFSVINGEDDEINLKIVLKAKNASEIINDLKNDGYNDFIFCEKIFSDKEQILNKIPEKGDYMSILFARKK